MATKERRTTDSGSFAREIETAEVSLFNEDLEEDFYLRQSEIIDLNKSNPSEAKKLRYELKKEIRKELEDEMDDEFDRFSLYTELLSNIVVAKRHLNEMKIELNNSGIKNFLLEFHSGEEGNSNHIQYTGNKSTYADEILVNYINKNKLSLHYVKKPKEELGDKTISKTLDNLLMELTKTYENATNMFSKQILSGKERLAQWKLNIQSKTKEIDDVLSTYNDVKTSRRTRR